MQFNIDEMMLKSSANVHKINKHESEISNIQVLVHQNKVDFATKLDNCEK